MNPELGRFFEGRRLDTIQLLKAIYDVGTGAGPDVETAIDGRELVFSRGPAGGDRGFLRAIPGEVNVTVAFPKAGRLFDPRARLKGPRRSQRSVLLTHPAEIDPYLRRLIDAAYAEG